MTKEDSQLLFTLEARIRHLMLMCDNLKEENAVLKKQLSEELELKKILENNYRKLEDAYNHLKTAKIISVGDNDKLETKQRLSKLVREVDKCIALLKA